MAFLDFDGFYKLGPIDEAWNSDRKLDCAIGTLTKDIEFEVEVPGFGKGDLDIEVRGEKLFVRGRMEVGERTKEFNKSYFLPKNTDIEGITCKVENGLLVFHLPCKQPSGRKLVPL